MSHYISNTLRIFVIKRANHCCEYCRTHEKNSFYAFHIDHIISIKHGGKTVANNLAYACQICNQSKGSDLATFLEYPNRLIRFFNPRIDIWSDHFELETTGFITPQTSIAEATLKIFELNHPDSIIERREMLQRGLL